MQEKEVKNSEISERIAKLIERLGFNPNTFANTLGYKRSQTIYDILNGKSKPSFDFFARLMNTDISERCNLEWLFTGRGDMLKGGDGQQALPEVQQSFPLRTDRIVDLQSIPLYEIDATAGLVSLFDDTLRKEPISHLQIPNLPACDGAVYVRGDSMYPLLKSGDIVLYKEVRNSVENMLWGEMYLLSFMLDGEDYITIKYLQKADDERYVRLVSHNPYHAPKEIPIDSIRALALIKASVRYNTMG